ncbi:MAG TPA: hypothetical protein VFW40_09585, partial [Capsulimonadaceae bacterium]|nr:hypothetical protein [Capsulimonadaceae bacterium]
MYVPKLLRAPFAPVLIAFSLAACAVFVATPAPAAAAPSVLIYRGAPSPMGENTAVSLWLYSDAAGGSARIRVMATSGRATAPALVRGAGEDSEPLWPAWISDPIPLTFSGWKHIVLTRDQLTYRPPSGTPANAAPALHIADADAVGIDTDRRRGTLYLDDIAWVQTDATGAVTGTQTMVDDFETGNVASWTEHGTPEAVQALVYGVTTTPAFVKQGRTALKLDFTQSAALEAAGLHRLASAMAVTKNPYVIYVPSTPFERILPDSTPQAGELKTSMDTFACAGQTQPASFCLYSKKPLTDVSVAPKTDLLGVGHKVSRSVIDIRVVKVWDRDGIGPLLDPDAHGPMPELLVKDDRQPLTMNGSGPPDVRLTGYPLTDLPAGTSKQFWVDVTLPADTPPGNYSAELVVSAKEMKPAVVSLTVDVLPLRLMSPSKQYAIGFRGKLGQAPASATTVSTDYVSHDEFSAELADIAAHGFRYATLTDSGPALWDAVAAYQQAGLGSPVVYDGLTGQDDLDTIKSIEQDRASHKEPALVYVVPSTTDQAKEMAAMKDNGLEAASF